MNSVIDSSAFFISPEECQDSDKRSSFFQHLLDNFKIINEFKITKIYWRGEFDNYLMKNPLFVLEKNRNTPIYYRYRTLCMEYIEIQEMGRCKVDPALSCKHGNKEFNDHFMELMHNLLTKAENIFLLLGIDNQSGDYVFSCDCHIYELKPDLIKNTNDWFKHIPNDLETDSWKHKENYFPKREFSDGLVNDWDKFREDLKKLSSEKKMARIKEIGSLIAKINGYKYNSNLSGINQKKHESARSIHQSGKKRNTIYLSIDFEKGAFEVCDFKGIHLGEFSFNGKKLDAPDKTGKHNIILKP